MKVFISWSGDISLRFAQNFSGWLESVIQAVRPFVSANDIRTGSRWFSEIGKQLEETNFGILCVTPDNKEAPWLLFEAGALSKKVEQSRVCPLLLGVKNSDLIPPLSMFHTAEVTEPKKILKLLTDINSTLGQDALSESVLSRVFEKNWGDLDAIVKNTLAEIHEAQKKHGAPAKRSSEEMLEELLGIARGMAQNLGDIRTVADIQMPPDEYWARMTAAQADERLRAFNPSISDALKPTRDAAIARGGLTRGKLDREAAVRALIGGEISTEDIIRQLGIPLPRNEKKAEIPTPKGDKK